MHAVRGASAEVGFGAVASRAVGGRACFAACITAFDRARTGGRPGWRARGGGAGVLRSNVLGARDAGGAGPRLDAVWAGWDGVLRADLGRGSGTGVGRARVTGAGAARAV